MKSSNGLQNSIPKQTILFASNNADDFIIDLGGQSPEFNATIKLNPETANAITMLTKGNRALASDTATQWTLWQTGHADIYKFKNMIPLVIKRVVIGCIFIVIS